MRVKPVKTKKTNINMKVLKENHQIVCLRVEYTATFYEDRGDYWTAPSYDYQIEINKVALIDCSGEEHDFTVLFKDYNPLLNYISVWYSGQGEGHITRRIDLEVPLEFYYGNNLNQYYDE